MNSRATEILVGLFMLLFLAAMFVLAMKVSNLTSLTSPDGYTLIAKFENIVDAVDSSFTIGFFALQERALLSLSLLLFL